MSLEEKLKSLQKREKGDLEVKMDKVVQLYQSIPDTIAQTAELTGIPAEMLVQCCVEVAWHYQDLEWYHIMEITLSFHLAKKRGEMKSK